MSTIISPFRIENNRVIEFKLIQNYDLLEFDTICFNLGVDYKISDIQKEQDDYSAKVDLSIKLEGKAETGEVVFDIDLVMTGLFKGQVSELDQERFVDLIKVNGVATLMQLSRAYIASVTALSGFGKPIHFPMVNVFELNKLKESMEKI